MVVAMHHHHRQCLKSHLANRQRADRGWRARGVPQAVYRGRELAQRVDAIDDVGVIADPALQPRPKLVVHLIGLAFDLFHVRVWRQLRPHRQEQQCLLGGVALAGHHHPDPVRRQVAPASIGLCDERQDAADHVLAEPEPEVSGLDVTQLTSQ